MRILSVVFVLSYTLIDPSPAYISHSSVPSSPKVIAPPDDPCIETFVYPVKLAGPVSLIPISPLELMRIASLPAVSKFIVLALGNLIAVSVSPV